MVLVEVTDKNAIYVDGYRITDRSTKWGVHNIIDEFECKKDDVSSECWLRGHRDAFHKIDVEEYKL